VVHVLQSLDVLVLLRAFEMQGDQILWRLMDMAYVSDVISHDASGFQFTMGRHWSANPKLEEVILV
jgi:hypothetical protein